MPAPLWQIRLNLNIKFFRRYSSSDEFIQFTLVFASMGFPPVYVSGADLEEDFEGMHWSDADVETWACCCGGWWHLCLKRGLDTGKCRLCCHDCSFMDVSFVMRCGGLRGGRVGVASRSCALCGQKRGQIITSNFRQSAFCRNDGTYNIIRRYCSMKISYYFNTAFHIDSLVEGFMQRNVLTCQAKTCPQRWKKRCEMTRVDIDENKIYG